MQIKHRIVARYEILRNEMLFSNVDVLERPVSATTESFGQLPGFCCRVGVQLGNELIDGASSRQRRNV